MISNRRWLVVNAALTPALVNLALNAAIARLSCIGHPTVALWALPIAGGPSIVADTLGTLFILPLVTNAFVSSAVHRDLGNGRLIPATRSHCALARSLADGATRRGVLVGLGCLVVLGPPCVAGLVAAGVGHLSVAEFVEYKAAFAVLLGAVVTPPIALLAIAEYSIRIA